MNIFKLSVAVMGLVFTLAFPIGARAATIIMEFSVPDGFDVSFNGAPDGPSGQMTFTILIDDTTPDLLPGDITRGVFAVTSVNLTVPDLGIINEAIVSPTFEILTFDGGIALRQTDNLFGSGGIGWNGTPKPNTFMSDLNDLSTLPLPTFAAISTTFMGGGDPLTMASGTVEGDVPSGGPDGTFSAVSAIPEPSTITVTALGLAGIARRRKSRV